MNGRLFAQDKALRHADIWQGYLYDLLLLFFGYVLFLT